MVVFSLRVHPAPAQCQAAASLIERLLAPTRVEPGCESCRLYVDSGDSTSWMLIEEWSSQAALDRHLRSDAFKSLIAMMEMSSMTPQVRFDTILRREGIEAFAAAVAGTTHP